MNATNVPPYPRMNEYEVLVWIGGLAGLASLIGFVCIQSADYFRRHRVYPTETEPMVVKIQAIK